MIALLAGAGFAKWAADLPLAKDLFDFQIDSFGIREDTKLNKVCKLKSDWDRMNPTQPAEAFISYAMDQNTDIKNLVLWYVVRRLSDPYIWKEWHSGKWRRHVLMIDEQRKNDRPGVKETKEFLISVLGPLLSGIITTNYDLLFEYALGTAGFNYGRHGEELYGRGPYPLSRWLSPITLTGNIPMGKVHGSISWDENGRYTDGRRGLTGKALRIAPVPHKSPPSSLQPAWELSKKILNGSSELLVFGFAFNSYDSAFLDYLHIHWSGLKSIMIVDISPNTKAARQIWPNANISTVKPPPAGEKELRQWIKINAIEKIKY